MLPYIGNATSQEGIPVGHQLLGLHVAKLAGYVCEVEDLELMIDSVLKLLGSFGVEHAEHVE